MTNAVYIQRGEALDYLNETDETIPAGAVVTLGARVGVAGCPIEPGETGSVHMTGVFEIAKTGAAALAMGQALYFDGAGLTDTAGDVLAGYAAAPAEAKAATARVKLTG